MIDAQTRYGERDAAGRERGAYLGERVFKFRVFARRKREQGRLVDAGVARPEDDSDAIRPVSAGERAKGRVAVKSKLEESADGKSEGKKDELAIEFGKFCLDLAKLTFGGVFLAAIMEMSYDMSKAVSLGAVAIVLLSILGFIFIKIGNKK